MYFLYSIYTLYFFRADLLGIFHKLGLQKCLRKEQAYKNCVFENFDLSLLPLFWLIAFLLIYIFVLLSVYDKDNHSVLLWQMVNN